MQEHVISDFSGGLNLTADFSKTPDRECVLADACRFDQLGNVECAGATAKQNSSALSGTSSLTTVHSLHVNPTVRHIALVGKDVFAGAALSGLTSLVANVNSGSARGTFESYNSRVFFDTGGTPRFIDNNGFAHTVDWVPPAASVSSAGPTSAGTGASSGTPAWTNPGNITASDNTYATSSASQTQTGNLQATNYGFAIPAGSTILGVVAEVECKQDIDGDPSTIVNVAIMKGGTAVGNYIQGSLTLSDSYVSFGQTGDMTDWDTTLTATDVNASNFGVQIYFLVRSTSTITISVDHVRITVYYSAQMPTLALGAAGNPNGTYTYKITFGAATGEESQASAASASVAPASQQVAISAIALGDSKTTKRFIYRKGAGLTFYYRIGTIADNTSTTFTDNVSDATALSDGILLQGEAEGTKVDTRIGASANVKYPRVHFNRLFWIDQSTGQQNRLIWSREGNHFSYPATNYIDIGDRKPGTGIVSFLDDLIAFKTDSIWRLSGKDESSFNLTKTPATHGTDMPLTIVKLQDRIMFTNDNGIWYFDGVTVRPATNRLDLFFSGQTRNGISPPLTNDTYTANFCATYGLNTYYLSYADTGTANNRVLLLDMKNGTISRRNLVALSLATDPTTGLVYFGDASGFVKRLEDWTATADSGASVSFVWQSKFYNQNSDDNKSYWGVVIDYESGGQTLTPTVYFDGDTATGTALSTVSSSGRVQTYVPIPSGTARKAISISLKLAGTLTTVNTSNAPAVKLYGLTFMYDTLKQRSRVS